MEKIKKIIISFIHRNNKLHLFEQLKILKYSFKGLSKDNLGIMASALTLYSLLSLVPMIALVFAVSKGFGLEKLLAESILSKVGAHVEMAQTIIDFSNKLLNNTKGGMIAGIGVVFLLWSSTRLFDLLEKSVNIIWNIKTHRGVLRKTIDYIAILIVVPILLIVGSSLLILMKVKLELFLNDLQFLGSFGNSLVTIILSLIPYIIIIFAIILLYVLVPNTKVKFLPAAISGIISGSILIFTTKIFFNMQIMISKYNAIYGSFSFIPILLIYIQIAWLIVLMGTEICYVNEYIDDMNEYSLKDISVMDKIKGGILIMRVIVKRFEKGLEAVDYEHLAKISKLPNRALRELVDPLLKYNLIVMAAEEDNNERFLPARDINKIYIVDVLNAYLFFGNNRFIDNGDLNHIFVDSLLEELSVSKNNVKILSI